jgi:hypothetical protein
VQSIWRNGVHCDEILHYHLGSTEGERFDVFQLSIRRERTVPVEWSGAGFPVSAPLQELAGAEAVSES